jgi:prevent-host-death family protein
MKTLNIQAAKTHLSRLVEEAVAGDDIVIAKAGKPMVKLVPIGPRREPRKLGFMKGKIWTAPGCWEPDLELARQMEEGSVFPEIRQNITVRKSVRPKR